MENLDLVSTNEICRVKMSLHHIIGYVLNDISLVQSCLQPLITIVISLTSKLFNKKRKVSSFGGNVFPDQMGFAQHVS